MEAQVGPAEIKRHRPTACSAMLGPSELTAGVHDYARIARTAMRGWPGGWPPVIGPAGFAQTRGATRGKLAGMDTEGADDLATPMGSGRCRERISHRHRRTPLRPASPTFRCTPSDWWAPRSSIQHCVRAPALSPPERQGEVRGVVACAGLAVLAARSTRRSRLLAAGWAAHALFDATHRHSASSLLPGWYPALCAGYDLALASALTIPIDNR